MNSLPRDSGAARIFQVKSLEETRDLALKIGPQLPESCTICFFGDLGSGKTTFIKGLAESRGTPADQVTSPTFVYLNIYPESGPLFHFDLYRLTKGVDEFIALGFDEFLYGPGLKCIEWSEKIEPIVPPDALRIRISHRGENEREISVEGL